MNSSTLIAFLSNKQISRDSFWKVMVVVMGDSHCASCKQLPFFEEAFLFLACHATAAMISFSLLLLVLKAFVALEAIWLLEVLC